MTTLTLNLRVHHACDKREHTTALTLNPVRLNSGLIRLECTRCDGRPLHPNTCDRYDEDDPITCGWRRAVADMRAALESEARP